VSIRESFGLSAFKSDGLHIGIGRFLAKAKTLRGTVRGHIVSPQAAGCDAVAVAAAAVSVAAAPSLTSHCPCHLFRLSFGSAAEALMAMLFPSVAFASCRNIPRGTLPLPLCCCIRGIVGLVM